MQPSAARAVANHRAEILAAARELFDERGYADVSVREIAERAGVSAALVMKHGGSKLDLFREAAALPSGPKDFGEHVDGLGEQLVEEVLVAEREGHPSPLTRSVVLMVGAPDVAQRREAVRQRYVVPLTQVLMDDLGVDETEARARARAALAVLVGISTSLRTLHLFAPVDARDLQERMAPLVQAALDGR